ncbi:MoxR-like ATPase [Sulfobacillus thermosulfidooxidans DSM 9293]|uniref:MoxR-like ATPase n=1 Tax=Sulfobacillus thermosulfidooxidans (strain DSM 9293 / VKM B-1269 / AT-1) TaxID=929705 RepID=A0A1W1WBN2_SULTA|nr:AAA family ATPase [Sulfobacillus thermosulfidooxidans]SMC03704.1 MoxR-like ATPase [Sulfobacillus thermosulfidooxidans DSM 9293]
MRFDENHLAFTVIGRDKERQLIVAALMAKRPVLLVGAPGTSKTTLLQGIVHTMTHFGGVYPVTGDDQLSITALVGTYDPAGVMKDGYKPEYFIPGPLTQAMEQGGILYIEELNRTQSSTLNALLTVLSDGYLDIPRRGRIWALESFGVVAASNPLDDVGTERLSRGLLDRFVTIYLDYQTRDEEQDIVRQHVPRANPEWIDYSVEVMRRTRQHQDLLYGSSVRGAIDFLKILEHVASDGDTVIWDVGITAFSSKVAARPSAGRRVQDILLEIMKSQPLPNPPPFSHWPSFPKPPETANGPGMLGSEARRKNAGDSTTQESLPEAPFDGKESPSSSTRIDMAWQGETGGIRGRSLLHESPDLPPSLHFGLTQQEERRGDKPSTPWVDEAMLKQLRSSHYAPLLPTISTSYGRRYQGHHVVPFREGIFGELDVAATLDNLARDPTRDRLSSMMMRALRPGTRHFALLVDHSGSMAGEKLAVALAISSVLAYYSHTLKMAYGVYVFDQQVHEIKRTNDYRTLDEVVEHLLHLEEGRSTDLSLALRYAAQLGDRDPDLEVILVSDLMPTRGEKTFGALRQRIQKIPHLYICHVPKAGERVFSKTIDHHAENLDLYGLWGLSWVGAKRFCSVTSLRDISTFLGLLSGRDTWL